MDNNELRIRGNVATDPTQTVIADGTRLTSFRLASNTRRRDKATDEWVTTETIFLTVTCWRQLGDNAYASLHRGDLVDVRGRLRVREYDDKDGKKATAVEVEAYAVAPDLARYIVTMAKPPRPLPVEQEGDVVPGQRVADAAAEPAA